MRLQWELICAGGFALLGGGVPASAQTPGQPTAPANPAGQSPAVSGSHSGSHSSSAALPVLESSAPKRYAPLTYSRARYRTVSSYPAGPNIVNSASVTMYYQPAHLRLSEIDLLANYYHSPRRGLGSSGDPLRSTGSGLLIELPPVPRR